MTAGEIVTQIAEQCSKHYEQIHGVKPPNLLFYADKLEDDIESYAKSEADKKVKDAIEYTIGYMVSKHDLKEPSMADIMIIKDGADSFLKAKFKDQ